MPIKKYQEFINEDVNNLDYKFFWATIQGCQDYRGGFQLEFYKLDEFPNPGKQGKINIKQVIHDIYSVPLDGEEFGNWDDEKSGSNIRAALRSDAYGKVYLVACNTNVIDPYLMRSDSFVCAVCTPHDNASPSTGKLIEQEIDLFRWIRLNSHVIWKFYEEDESGKPIMDLMSPRPIDYSSLKVIINWISEQHNSLSLLNSIKKECPELWNSLCTIDNPDDLSVAAGLGGYGF